MWVTGGALESTKTFWCKIAHDGKDEGREISLSQGGHNAVITRRSPAESFYTLGVWQLPSGCKTNQVEHLRKLVTTWSATTEKVHISRYSARTALVSTIGRTIAYPLAASGLSSLNCKSLQSSINSAVLGRIGIVRTVSKLLANAPTYLGGHGIVDVEKEQLVQHIGMLSLHMHQPTLTSAMIKISLESYILEAGRSESPFEFPHCEYVTQWTWISNMLYSMKKYNITIQATGQWLEKWGPSDRFIMEVITFKNASEARIFNSV